MATPVPSPSTNPFRTPHLTPQNTNQSSSSSLPPPARQRRPDTPTPTPAQRTGTSLADVITEDAPPPYTPAADPYQGEATVEYGPRRPFQRAPPAARTQAPPRPMSPQRTGAMNAPPPRPTSPPPVARNAVPTRPDLRHDASQSVMSPLPRFAPPPGRPPSASPAQLTPRFAPPAGQPPRRAASSASAHAAPPAPSPATDDARPTTAPTPGHPLLRDGRLLVYPVGYTCSKCANTGYKHFDPAHPCRKCWERHARPYAGALFYAPAAAGAGAPGNFQRPLPRLRPPHAHAGGPPGAQQRLAPTPPPPPPPPPPPTAVFAHPFAPPPPGATVVRPGDPRIGGRLCWRCGGGGTVSFMIFDEDTCEVCRGMGRVFN